MVYTPQSCPYEDENCPIGQKVDIHSFGTDEYNIG